MSTKKEAAIRAAQEEALAVCKTLGYDYEQIAGKSRLQPLLVQRYIVCLIMRERGHQVVHIAAALGGRDHTTIINAISEAQKPWMAADLLKARLVIMEAEGNSETNMDLKSMIQQFLNLRTQTNDLLDRLLAQIMSMIETQSNGKQQN